ncbi:hypothetical protein FBEOM_174 [Fusarium beomiforme]|uniref:BZIP domain-containing protein n=1 Tax=Fusarium beomiforme TaxID=44412 RepID=A0A9P5E7K7_9HYPO|nr:hypothetical protein FBEOM_174 [Fusarium beomiforme]
MLGHNSQTSVISEANNHRRKLQNRKNQRARRQRLKGQDAEPNQASAPFEIKRWRVDEIDSVSPQETGAGTTANMQHFPCRTFPSTAEDVVLPESSLVPRLDHITTVDSTPQSFNLIFPLSSDHLLHLIQYNVFRAFISIKLTLNTVFPNPKICPVFGPCLDDTTRYPPNPNTPPSLFPTTLQLTQYHFPWINLMPFPRVRDNFIRREGHFDVWELWRDLVGDHLSFSEAAWRRGTGFSFSTPSHELQQPSTRLADNYLDVDEVTAGRNGLIIWGEPHDIQSWEATPGFLRKWSWAVEGCDELIEISNRWRMGRGEEPMQLSTSRPGKVFEVRY